MTISSGAYLGLDGPNGKTRVTIPVLDDPILTLYGEGEGADAIRVLLGVNDVDLILFNKDTKVIWSAPYEVARADVPFDSVTHHHAYK